MRWLLLLLPLLRSVAASEPEEGDTVFFFNNVTGESRGDRPAEMPLWSQDSSRPYWVVGSRAVWTPPEAWAWTPHTDPDGRTYFFNFVNEQTSWSRPPCLGWSARSTKRYFWYNRATGASQRERPSVLGYQAEGHKVPYYPLPDGGTTWSAPPEAAWKEHLPAVHGEAPYYSNSLTGEVAWEAPPEAAVHWVPWHEELS